MWINLWAHKTTNGRRILVVAGLILVIAIILALKDKPAPAPTQATSNLPEVQLDRALANHKPILAFFHSNNCEQCIIMIETIDQVHPEFAASIDLVDVNVYDPNNEPLLRKVGLQYIPTLVFFDRSGQSQTHVGVMEADALRQQLSSMTGAQ